MISLQQSVKVISEYVKIKEKQMSKEYQNNSNNKFDQRDSILQKSNCEELKQL